MCSVPACLRIVLRREPVAQRRDDDARIGALGISFTVIDETSMMSAEFTKFGYVDEERGCQMGTWREGGHVRIWYLDIQYATACSHERLNSYGYH